MLKRCIKALEVEGIVKTHGRTSRLLLSEATAGAKGFTLGLNITKPGGMSPMHTHEKEQEAMYIISGKGKAIIGEEEYDLEPDTVIIAPAGVPHELRNTGDEDIKFIWVYCPPLPDQK
ncbi:MAG: hypothetical protein PWP65_223 [Clostridia bacterium]|nr:hypothetical protein [Clostridia bacterium]